jgi:hypothetical protein
MEEQPVVRIAVAESEPIALMWQEILAQHGIRSMVKAAGGAHAYSPVPGPYYLYVLGSEAERSRSLLGLEEDDNSDGR